MAGLERRLCGLWLVLRYPGQPRHSTLSVKLTRGRLSNDIPLPAHIIKSDGTTVETNRSLPLRNNLHESNQHTAALSSTGLLSCTYLYLCSCAFYQLLNTISLNSNVCMNLRQITTATKPSTTSTTPWLISQSALLAPSNPARRIGKRIQSDFNSFLSLTALMTQTYVVQLSSPCADRQRMDSSVIYLLPQLLPKKHSKNLLLWFRNTSSLHPHPSSRGTPYLQEYNTQEKRSMTMWPSSARLLNTASLAKPSTTCSETALFVDVETRSSSTFG